MKFFTFYFIYKFIVWNKFLFIKFKFFLFYFIFFLNKKGHTFSANAIEKNDYNFLNDTNEDPAYNNIVDYMVFLKKYIYNYFKYKIIIKSFTIKKWY
jgi:hypothetical protein